MTGGGLSPDGSQWGSARPKYLFPVKVISRLFRGIFLDALKGAHKRGEIRLDGIDIKTLVDPLYRTDWVVYAKPPFGGPEHVFKDLGRYTHRVGISN